MCRLFDVQLGAHTMTTEMGRRLRMAQGARICPFCPDMHVGDERRHVFERPACDDICCGFQHLLDDAVRLCIWHFSQKDVALCLLQLPGRIDETLT